MNNLQAGFIHKELGPRARILSTVLQVLQIPDTPWDCHICLHGPPKPPQLIGSPMAVPLVVSGNGMPDSIPFLRARSHTTLGAHKI